MIEYMRALYRQFYVISPEERTIDKDIIQLHKELSDTLDKPDRKKLLRILDLEDHLQSCTGLNSFIAGFRVANGLYHELNLQPAYSFALDEERRAGCTERSEAFTYENLEN